MKEGKIYFRANGSSEIGLGHFVRSLALMQMISKKYHCTLIVNADIPKEIIPKYINYIFININNSKDETIFLKKILNNKDILILDGYNFDISFQNKIKKTVKKLIVIDDFKNKKHNCDVLINHGVKNILTQKKSLTCSGFDHLILRKEFLLEARKKKNLCLKKNVFVCLGGSDPFNITNKVIRVLIEIPEIEKINVILGAANERKDKLLKKFNSDKVNFHVNVTSSNIIKILKNTSLGISTSSTIALEICSTGTPLICGWINRNQKCIDDYVVSENCAISVGSWNNATTPKIKEAINKMLNAELLNSILQNQSQKIDGKSNKRFLNLFNELMNE